MLYSEELKSRREQLVVMLSLTGDAIQTAKYRGQDASKLETLRVEMVRQLEKVTGELEKFKPAVSL